MNKYIDAYALSKRAHEVAYPVVYDSNSHERGLSLTGLAQLLDEISPADVRENLKGEWIKNSNGTWSCNQCQSWIPDEQHFYANYCLCCGADMRKK